MPKRRKTSPRIESRHRKPAVSSRKAATATTPLAKTALRAVVKQKRASRKTPEAFREAMPPEGGEGKAGAGRKPGDKSVWEEIKEELKKPKVRKKVVSAFIGQAEKGNYAFHQEIINRQDGRVPNRVANADGSNVKAYVNLPTGDDPEAP